MTLRTKHGRIGLRRHKSARVLGMLGLRAMASLAGDSSMFAFGLYLGDICVAGFADFMSGVDDGQCRNLRNGVAAVMSVFSEAMRD